MDLYAEIFFFYNSCKCNFPQTNSASLIYRKIYDILKWSKLISSVKYSEFKTFYLEMYCILQAWNGAFNVFNANLQIIIWNISTYKISYKNCYLLSEIMIFYFV